jgi:hypothetical protein
MCESDVTTRQSETIEVRNISQTSLLLNHLAFGCILRCVSVNHHAASSR